MIKTKKILIMLLIYSNYLINKIDTKSLIHKREDEDFNELENVIVNKCKDPKNEELEEKLSKEFKKILAKIEEGIDIYPPVQRKYNISKLSNDNSISNSNGYSYRRHGNQNCSKNEQTIWHSNEISICPYHFVEIKRKNRFPFSFKQAVCNCKECIGVRKSKCLPVNIAKPALERDFCNLKTGYFEWNFVMEYVTVSCSCKQMLELD